ncbi:MAG: calcium-binding protein [Patescibacteria group bacterium]
MKHIKSKLFKILAINLSLILAISFIAPKAFDSSTVLAIGDLAVDWGVPEGNPIFTITNMAPGQTETRTVSVTNTGSGIRPVGIRGVKTSEAGNISTVLNITISLGATDLYGGTSPTGPKTLANFFTESAGINGIFLSNINSGQTVNYIVKVNFQNSAGNEFQNSQVIFDLIIGISIDLPQECEAMQFSGSPIFGTSQGDSLKGTPNNDLIIGFEGGDSIDGKGGDDCILGGIGGDSLKGGEGNDFVFGNEDHDSLKGGSGVDLLVGGAGHDSIYGEGGSDKLVGEDGDDSLHGGGGDDELQGGDGKDSLKGGGQNDTLIGGAGSFDSANGEGGTDVCVAESEKNCELDP